MPSSSERPADFLTRDANRTRIFLSVHLQPGAKSTAIAGLHGDALKIRIAAPAVDNKANAALVAFLSGLLGVASRNIGICSGLHSRRKQIAIVCDTNQIAAQLRAAIANQPD